MANGVFNIAKGRVVEFYSRVKNNDPAASALVVVLLTTTGLQADGTLIDHDDLAAITGAGNTEATFTNYARKIGTDDGAGVDFALAAVPSPDDGADSYSVDIPDQVWTSAGGATNNTLAKLLICYDNDTAAGTDANIIPLTHHDFSVTTDGSDLTAVVNANGFFTAS